MTSHPPGRELVEALHLELAATASEGRALFLETAAGPDLAACIRDFVGQARRSNRLLRVVVVSAADPRISAWRHIALRLTARHRTVLALRQSAREWIGVLPLIGPLLGAIANTVSELRNQGPSSIAALGTGSAVDDVRRVLAHGRSEPRLIVLTDCEAADTGELAGAFAFVQQLRDTRTLLILTCTSHGAAPRGFSDLLWEAERLGVGRRFTFGAPRVSPAGAALLTIAARVGRHFDTAQLMQITRRSEPDLESELRALVRSNILALRGTVERNGEMTDVYEFTDPSATEYWRGRDADD